MRESLENLTTAFVRESQFQNSLLAYARMAKEDSAPDLAKQFENIAKEVQTHAFGLLEMIQDVKDQLHDFDDDEIATEVWSRFGATTTSENLERALKNIRYISTIMYPEFANTAADEGLIDITEKLLEYDKDFQHWEKVLIALK